MNCRSFGKNTYSLQLNMIKYILTFLIVLWSSSIVYSADECSASCPIVDTPAIALTEYFTNMDELIRSVSGTIRAEKTQQWDTAIEKDIYKTRSKIMTSLSQALSFEEYYGSFDFHIALPMTQTIPKPIKRDYNTIRSYTQRLTQMLEIYERRGAGWNTLPDICARLSYCEFPEDISVRDLLTQAINNNTQVLLLFTQSVSGKDTSNIQLTLVSPDFTSQILQYYNSQSLYECSQCQWEVVADFREQISNITIKTKNYQDGIQIWKDAWNLLTGKDPQWQKRSEEDRVLKEYLSSQNINSGQGDIVVENLKRYESSWISSSDPLMNSERYLQDATQREENTFQQTLAEKFKNQERVSITDIVKANKQISNTADIEKSINTLFEEQKPFAFTQDVATQQVQSRLINMHYSLTRSINILENISQRASKVCDRQWTGLGKCNYSR